MSESLSTGSSFICLGKEDSCLYSTLLNKPKATQEPSLLLQGVREFYYSACHLVLMTGTFF